MYLFGGKKVKIKIESFSSQEETNRPPSISSATAIPSFMENQNYL
jgi:hypothetical protein